MSYKSCCSAIAVLFAAAFLTSCSVTTAPTDASSETFGQTTDSSTDLSSSTTSDDDDDDDNEEMVEKFVASNFAQLRTDMSVGEGEYLTSLAALLAIDDGHKEQFYSLTKNKFNQLFVSSQTTPKELVINLKQEVAQANI